jgi:hypothetical protein
MPPDWIIKALNYGVAGLCAVIIVFTWRVIQSEQRRQGAPRKGILQFATAFMIFCALLAGLSAYVQVTEAKSERAAVARLDPVLFKLEEINNLLCVKVFFEVQQVKIRSGGHDTSQLEYLIGQLQHATSEAWAYSGAKRELQRCQSAG